MWESLCLCVPGQFGCPWPAGGEKPGQMAGGGGRVSALPPPSLGMRGLALALFAPMWTLRPSLTCLFKVAEPRFELGTPVPDPPGRKQLLARLPHPCPLIASHPFPRCPHPRSSPGPHS